MKRLRIKTLQSYNLLIAALLALIGFACSNEPMDEYGTPSAKFIVKGKVTSIETNQAIENIRVVMHGDTVFTNKDGAYQVVDRWGFPHDQTYHLRFQDIDGEAHGAFNNVDTLVEFVNPVFTGGNGKWYSGETSKAFDIKLTPQK